MSTANLPNMRHKDSHQVNASVRL